MDKSTESKISGPLLHWTKVMILNETKASLEKSSKVAYAYMNAGMFVRSTDMPKWAEVIKINSTSLLQITELTEKATEFIPEGMRSWPSQN